ncbi:hypothetical protein THII_3104 [Thioploca ingrica]|uniref:Uncharacterized protein n=1 Tax=Thioploca ingrica TaxID=40754 RepID=A0A090BVT2_9GAMM|nr:hypothetical protein THII_3104 [Thioploca ingrica]
MLLLSCALNLHYHDSVAINLGEITSMTTNILIDIPRNSQAYLFLNTIKIIYSTRLIVLDIFIHEIKFYQTD